MNVVKDIFRYYWPQLLGIAVFAIAVARYIQLGEWEDNLKPFILAFYGFVCVVAGDEVSEWTGRYGWTRQQFFVDPPSLIRFQGAFVLMISTVWSLNG